jgi:hypothetical protein
MPKLPATPSRLPAADERIETVEGEVADATNRSSTDRPHPNRLTGADAYRLHGTLIAGLALCVGAFTFELFRALRGHTFSWMYVFEWPLFAGFALYMWWNLYNGTDRRRQAPSDDTATDHPPDSELVAWNHYLRQLESDETGDDPALSRAPSKDPKMPPSRL